jgi:glycosyltransferase involved in cell wall biosynthesis
VDLAKRVFEEVRKSREDVVFIKAGYSEKLLGENILNLGWIKEDDMPKLFNSADVYLHTSEYEGFGLPILEAMACGIPVVASRVASIPEIVGKAGKLVDLDDEECVKEFAEAILQILDSNIKIDRPTLERSMEFSWEKTARETLEVYTEVL